VIDIMMISQESLHQMQQVSIAERIDIIELLLNSVKNELKQNVLVQKSSLKPFKVQRFHLGADMNIDRSEL
jgi:hypothetical protein